MGRGRKSSCRCSQNDEMAAETWLSLGCAQLGPEPGHVPALDAPASLVTESVNKPSASFPTNPPRQPTRFPGHVVTRSDQEWARR
jgi:hypothetical protein